MAINKLISKWYVKLIIVILRITPEKIKQDKVGKACSVCVGVLVGGWGLGLGVVIFDTMIREGLTNHVILE